MPTEDPGEPRVLRLDRLTTDERRLVEALLAAKRAADAAKPALMVGTHKEAGRDR